MNVTQILKLQEAVKSMKDVIVKHLNDHTVLTTDPVSVYIGTDLDECLQEAAEKLMKLVENYEGVAGFSIISNNWMLI